MKTLIGLGFIVLTIIFFWLLLRLLRPAMSPKAFRNTVVALGAWTIFLAGWSLSGMAARFELFPLNMAPVLVLPFVATLVITFLPATRDVLARIDPKSIARLQVFRVFVELLLWAMFVQDLLPVQMTFEGRNLDILSGLTAPFAAMFLVRSKWAMAAWNILCLGSLINIVTVAILSMPVPFRVFMNEPSNTVVARFPFILLPGMLVPLAYGLSFLSLRQVFSLTSPDEKISPVSSTAGVVQR